jgi:hypothetical protein
LTPSSDTAVGLPHIADVDVRYCCHRHQIVGHVADARLATGIADADQLVV